jgi:ubiquinol-cytochrome c reductase cytochrome b/c1 subunit
VAGDVDNVEAMLSLLQKECEWIVKASRMRYSTYQPQSAFMKWLERRLPVGALVHSSFVAYPTPRNLNCWWAFGGILTFMLGVQIVTGVALAMHYVPNVDFAFDSVEHIMRDVNYGWLLRYTHASGASFFFVAAYVHIARHPARCCGFSVLSCSCL